MSSEQQQQRGNGLSLQRELAQVAKNARLHCFCAVCGAYQGAVRAWLSSLSRWLSVAALCTAVASGVVGGAVCDWAGSKRTKLAMVALLLVSAVCWVALAVTLSTATNALLFASAACLAGVASNAATYGAAYEAAAELAYPSAELFAGAWLSVHVSLWASGFCVAQRLVAGVYRDWAVAAVLVVACGALAMMKVEHRRADLDDAALVRIKTERQKSQFLDYTGTFAKYRQLSTGTAGTTGTATLTPATHTREIGHDAASESR